DKETNLPEGANTLQNVPERVRLSIVHYSMMNTLAHLRGAEFALFLQPNSKVRPRETFSPDEAAKEPTSRDGRQFTYYNAYFEGIRAADKEFIFHDITGIFPPETAPFYYDLAHYTDRGAAVVAESVVDRIKPLIDKKLHEKSQTGDAQRWTSWVSPHFTTIPPRPLFAMGKSSRRRRKNDSLAKSTTSVFPKTQSTI